MTELMNPANQPNMVPDFGTQDPTQTEIVYMPVPMPSAEDYADSVLISAEAQPQPQEVTLTKIDDDVYYQERDEMVDRRLRGTAETLVRTGASIEQFEDMTQRLTESLRTKADQTRDEYVLQVKRSTAALRAAIDRLERDKIMGINTEYYAHVEEIDVVYGAATAVAREARMTQGGLETATFEMGSQHDSIKGNRGRSIDEHNSKVDHVGYLNEQLDDRAAIIDDEELKLDTVNQAIANEEASIIEQEREAMITIREAESKAYQNRQGDSTFIRQIDENGTRVVDRTALARAVAVDVERETSLKVSTIRAAVNSSRQTIASYRELVRQTEDLIAYEKLQSKKIVEDIDDYTRETSELLNKVEALREQGGKVDEITANLDNIAKLFGDVLDSSVVSALQQENIPAQLQPLYEQIMRFMGALNDISGGEAGFTSDNADVQFGAEVPLALSRGTGTEMQDVHEQLQVEAIVRDTLDTMVNPKMFRFGRLGFVSDAVTSIRQLFQPKTEVAYVQQAEVETEE